MRAIDEPADVVFVSHENDRYHSHLGQIIPPFQVVRGLEVPEAGLEVFGLRFEVVRVFETPERRPEDEVTIVHFRAEGLHVVSLGDLGHPLDEGELAPLRGRRSSWPPREALRRSTSPTSPRCSTPSGRGSSSRCTTRRRRSTSTSSPWSASWKPCPTIPVDRPGTSSIVVSRDSLPDRRRIVVLDHAR